MKKLLLFVLFSMSSLAIISAQDLKRWSGGLRTGGFYEAYSYKTKSAITDQSRYIRDGFYHQLFINYELGKRRNLMVEGNIGYNAYSYEDQGSEFDSNNRERYYYLFRKTKVLSFQLEARYAFYNCSSLKWKHYAGITIAAHRYINTDNSFSNFEDPDVYSHRSDKYSRWYNFFGVQYFGKISLSSKISTQYCVGYALSSTRFTPEGNYSILGEPVTHRLNVNFGFGYHF